mgnify:CR=1 FL=1
MSARQGAGSLARMPSPSGWQAQHDADYRAHWHALAARADPDALTWVVLGDSAAVGIGAESVERTYVAQVAERVAAFREAGVTCILASPTAPTHAERVTEVEHLRDIFGG